MSIKSPGIKLGLVALCVVILIATLPSLGAGDKAVAATSDCLKPLSAQEKTSCAKDVPNSELENDGKLALFLLPAKRDHAGIDRGLSKVHEEADPIYGSIVPKDILPMRAILLFGAALVGIVVLGRRRRTSPRG